MAKSTPVQAKGRGAKFDVQHRPCPMVAPGTALRFLIMLSVGHTFRRSKMLRTVLKYTLIVLFAFPLVLVYAIVKAAENV